MLPMTIFNLTSVTDLLHQWLSRQVCDAGLVWLDEKRNQIAAGNSERTLFTAFSTASRYTGKADLQLSEADLQAAECQRQGWFPGYWSLDQAGRTLLLLALPSRDREAYMRSLKQLFTAADVAELVALYQSLPLLPHPEQLRPIAIDGLRSNMTGVFNAIALHNPYPADYFDEAAWNQMVLKALFVGSPLHLIQGLDRRANPQLSQMLRDYAHERWAAGRRVYPDLWRLVGPFADDAALADLEKVLHDPEPIQQQAAALACAACPLPQAKALLAQFPELNDQIQRQQLSWQNLR